MKNEAIQRCDVDCVHGGGTKRAERQRRKRGLSTFLKCCEEDRREFDTNSHIVFNFHMMQYKHLQIIEGENHVVTIKLNRPSKRNAIDSKMWKEIGQLFSEIGTNGEDYRCILLLGRAKVSALE
ncbi:hypothetical protein CTEN210_02638 [Chaetoceros tenuissimus]|uniref:Uncharacterized protein n=1 Tax=Chaetoceros tenuissimus TaxID=426638 RepID=A0AAD3CIA6_9STRA|nr:hypothetical protein CTEN210_02638 [Chaetoceros tenuissimus]